ncbi:hypothetical protein TI04_00245 [Achromatium sp. WMS2]|nr:hypothetical protein TI04_00245 [Achromatium sp. WMS2]
MVAERFIPYRSSEIIDMLCADGQLSTAAQQQFRNFCTILQSLYHFEFHDKIKTLKRYYHPFDPDSDTRTNKTYSLAERSECETKLVANFTELLNAANYEVLTDKDIQYALKEEALFEVSLDIDFNDFASCILHRRGDIVKTATISKWMFWSQKIEVPTFERVVILVKFKDRDYFIAKGYKQPPFEPGSMVIKLFKDIPKADLEMLFPNVRVKMRLNDKLIMGIPAVSGLIGMIMKTGAGIIAFWILLKSLLGHIFQDNALVLPNSSELAQIIAGITALSAIGGFLFQQWTKYKNRKIEFLKTLGDNLYFKNLDNNVGVFHHVIDAAEEEECKEAILGYYFLLQHPNGLNAADLDHKVETWFATKYQVQIDFEVDDALRKLKALELCQLDAQQAYTVKDLDAACERLDFIWDNYFQYNT